MNVETWDDVRREVLARGFPTIEDAARYAQVLTGVYPSPNTCQSYQGERGGLTVFMRAFWSLFILHLDHQEGSTDAA